jgi:predicted O-methyltransferase YrrM
MLRMDWLRRLIKAGYRNFALSRLAGARLRKLAEECRTDVSRLVDLAFGFENNSLLHPRSIEDITIRPAQVRQEIIRLSELVSSVGPNCVIEIGTNNGGTLFLWTQLANPRATVISVDLPGGQFGGGYPSWRIPFYMAFRQVGQRLHLIRADSHEPSTLETVRRSLGESRVDFLFIDGDHSYEGVKRDFEMFAPLVRPGGIVAFHDILPHPEESGCEVDKFWAEVKSEFPHRELVQDAEQGWAGIGVLFMPEVAAAEGEN